MKTKAHMKSLILYGSHKPLTNAHKLVTPWPVAGEYYVRSELSHYDYTEVLKHAKPQPGEIVLNTVPLKPETNTTP